MANSKKNQKPAEPAIEATRVQRMLMYVGGSVLGLGIASIVALLIGEFTATKAVENNEGIWPVVSFMPLLAIPVAFLALIALMVITFRRRSQAAKGAGK